MPGFDRNFPVPVRFKDGRVKECIIPWAPEEAKRLSLVDPNGMIPARPASRRASRLSDA